MNEQLEQFKQWIKESDNIVFFGGAGVSTESGIPDFRSTDGLYNQQYDFPPETILSHSFFRARPEEFYRFYREKILINGIEPNITHSALAHLEEQGKLKAVITQNIDGLHQLAGSKEVLEVHGTVMKNTCVNCRKKFDAQFMIDSIDGKNRTTGVEQNPLRADGREYFIPVCDRCGGIIKPDVVLYEEGLDDYVWERSRRFISEADVLIVGGTSLVVYPAAGLINYYKGHKLVLINLAQTPYDNEADLVLHMKLGEVFREILGKN